MLSKEGIRLIIASAIVISWIIVELRYGRISDPTLELRLIILASVVTLFGESTIDYVLSILDRDEGSDG